ncbi:(2,3-dihydroxybenzoyl)adenylate synthase [Longispora sp. NPDC051575]|uniref:(2,3-dihydroxybenzoyl)adenylate synthase n=1 Tax=Longispora sp. NPDC051575 TaxID=3154943 RepID=UPI0034385865
MWPEDAAARYREKGYWLGETLGDFLRARAARFGARTAVVDGARRTSYAELDARADRLAAGLVRFGIARGDRVVVQLPNVLEFFDVVFALFRIGALPVFALPVHRATEIGYFCAHAEARAFVTVDSHEGFDHRDLGGGVPTIVVGEPGPHTALADLYDEPVPLDGPAAGDLAFLQLSGGSTGVPKLIPRTHDDYLYSVRASADICGLTTDSVYLVALPVAHNYPLSSPGVLGALHAGSRIVLAPRADPDTAFGLIERERVTITGVVPPLAIIWTDSAARADYDLSSLEVLQVGGAKFSAEAARRVGPALGCAVQQVFGMAEGLVNYTRLDDPEDIVTGTQGRPISPDDELRVVDEDDEPVWPGEVGHLLTRGPYTIRGYYRADAHNARAFTRDGFYRTGDLVRLTDGGYVVVEGRDKDQINRGGEKVAAEEVENLLLAHPAVLDAAVVAMPDPLLGERSCAYVIAREPVRGAVLRAHVRDQGLAAFKVPDRVEFLDAFPLTPVGKVDKKALRLRWEDA